MNNNNTTTTTVPVPKVTTGIATNLLLRFNVDNTLDNSYNSTLIEWGTLYSESPTPVKDASDTFCVSHPSLIDPNPAYPSDGSSWNDVVSHLDGNTTYNYRAYATSVMGTGVGGVNSIYIGGFTPIGDTINVDICWNDIYNNDANDGLTGRIYLCEVPNTTPICSGFIFARPDVAPHDFSISFGELNPSKTYKVDLNPIGQVINGTSYTDPQLCWACSITPTDYCYIRTINNIAGDARSTYCVWVKKGSGV